MLANRFAFRDRRSMSMLMILLGMVAGSALTWAHFRDQLAAVRQESDSRRKEIGRLEGEHAFAERRLRMRDRQLASATEEREQYAAIASSHEITTPRWAQGEWARKVWKERRFTGHPSQSLDDLRRELAPFADEHILLAFDIELLGGWKALILGEGAESSLTTPLSAGETLLFEGSGAQVLDQVIAFIMDDDSGFFERDEDEPLTGRWRDPDSPMVWRFTMDILHGATPKNTEFVEVLKVQKEYVETIVEKPVVRAVPDEIVSSLNRHTKEEIITLIEAVLEVREMALPARVDAERAALPPALGGSTPSDDG